MPGDSPMAQHQESPRGPARPANAIAPVWGVLPDVVAGCAFAAVVFLIASLGFHQPLVADDYWLRLLAQQHPHGLDYLVYMYKSWSFSWPTYLLEQLFTASRIFFGVAKAAAFVALAGLSLAVARGRLPRMQRVDLYGLVLLTCAYWFALPDLAETTSWSAGSAAYLWPTVAMLAFTVPFTTWLKAGERLQTRTPPSSILRSVLMVAIGFIAGSSQGQVVAALGFMLVFVAVYAIVRRIVGDVPWHLRAGAIGYVMGAFILASAPGNAVRTAAAGATNLGLLTRLSLTRTYYVALIIDYLPSIYPLLFGIVVASVPLILSNGDVSEIGHDRLRSRGLLWMGSAIASTLPFVLLPAFGSARTAFIPAVLLVVAALSCIPHEASSGWDHVPSVAVSGLLIMLLLATSLSVYRADRSARALSAEIRSREVFIESERARGVRNVVIPRLVTSPAYGVFMIDIPSNPSKFDIYINETMAKLYGVESIRTDPAVKP